MKRYPTVRTFLPLLCKVIRFGAAPDGEAVLRALKALPGLWGGGRNKVGAGEIGQSLLAGRPAREAAGRDACTATKPMVLASRGLPADPREHLEERTRLLHDTYREVASRLSANAAASFDDVGRLHPEGAAGGAGPAEPGEPARPHPFDDAARQPARGCC
ncbi:hypothetical protein CU254_25990 [Amycolatopsis sp. AA4]|uniref:hypothetical protein n=1 Tax=Actinomycetes TaxID=1760 RepID=UPI0001B545EB|nr:MULTISPECIES: hypothetical protein [Actinomycetes]ATY13494.1 hypothetical protein CU254_25990 [Amycolatopsis sp. AA4]EFL09448.1 predicted protein [Streptomyces sp. AA4]